MAWNQLETSADEESWEEGSNSHSVSVSNSIACTFLTVLTSTQTLTTRSVFFPFQ